MPLYPGIPFFPSVPGIPFSPIGYIAIIHAFHCLFENERHELQYLLHFLQVNILSFLLVIVIGNTAMIQ